MREDDASASEIVIHGGEYEHTSAPGVYEAEPFAYERCA